MQIDAFAIRLRAGSGMEAADLGVRLCQSAARSAYPCYFMVLVPIVVISFACFAVASWLPTLVMWLAKPWLDRTILFVLSRAAFGQTTRPRDVWRAQREVWWRQFVWTWTQRRLSPWRSLTQPVYQLEGSSLWKLRRRLKQVRAGQTRAALLMTSAYSFAEMSLSFAVISLLLWFAPSQTFKFNQLMQSGVLIQWASAGAYAFVIAFLEPFYVAAGFAMYLNRRVQLEAWDIEQEFRRAFVQ